MKHFFTILFFLFSVVFSYAQKSFVITPNSDITNGSYSGTGYVIVPYLADMRLKVTFNNIQINTDRKLINGYLETTYDATEKNVINVNSIVDNVDSIINNLIVLLNSGDTAKYKAAIDSLQNITLGQLGNDTNDSTNNAINQNFDELKDIAGNTPLNSQENQDSVTSKMNDIEQLVQSVANTQNYIGFILDNFNNTIYFCNSQNNSDSIKIRQALRNIGLCSNGCNVLDTCNIVLKQGFAYRLLWGCAIKDASNNMTISMTKKQTDSIYYLLNGNKKETDGITYDSLKEGNNSCQLMYENTATKQSKVVAQFNLQQFGTVTKKIVLEVHRTIDGNDRKDYYDGSSSGIGNESSEIPLSVGEQLLCKVLEISLGNNENDTTEIGNGNTQWLINHTNISKGTQYTFKVSDTANNIGVQLDNGDTLFVSLNVLPPNVFVAGVSLDYSAVASSKQDTVDARKYYNTALPACNKNDIGNFISHAPKNIVIKISRIPAQNNTITQGESNDGANITAEYQYLDLDEIQVDNDGAIIDAKLISRISKANNDEIINSVKNRSTTQICDKLLYRIAQTDSTISKELRKDIISGITPRQNLLDSIRYEVKATDQYISDWISFFNVDNIVVNVNLEKLGETDAIANTPQKDFTRIVAHEMLHDWWTFNEPFLKLKWHIIEDKAKIMNYILADGLSSGAPQNSNQSCSEGAGHERHNPETVKVCIGQYNY